MNDTLQTSSEMGRHAFSTVTTSVFGIVAGVVLDMIVVATFGLTSQTDAYYIAVTIPLVVITMMALQATRVVQPLFIKKKESDGDGESWNYLNLIMTTGTALVAVFALVGAILSPVLVGLQSAGAPTDAVRLTTRLSVYLFIILPLNFPIVVMRAALQSLGIFALTGAMKFFESCFKILLIVLLGPRLGIEALIWGTLAGAVFQIVSFGVVLARKGFRYRPIFRFNHPEVIQAAQLMIFPLAGQACAMAVESITNALGSQLGPGNVTALRLATRIIESFAGLLPGSIVIAAMPTVVASMAVGDLDATRKHLQQGLRMLALVTVPFAFWLTLTSRPLITLLYERGSFSADDTALVANILVLLIPFMFAGRFRGLLELPFFAAQDTRTPLLGALVSAGVFVVLSFSLVSGFGVYGIPVGRSVAYIVGAVFMDAMLRRRIGTVGFISTWGSMIRITGASLAMAAFIGVAGLVSWSLPATGIAGKAAALALPSMVGSVVLVVSLAKLGVITFVDAEAYSPLLGRCLSRLTVLTGYHGRSA